MENPFLVIHQIALVDHALAFPINILRGASLDKKSSGGIIPEISNQDKPCPKIV